MSAEWAAATFAGIAAAIAIWQVRVQIRAERRQAAFAHIRQIAEILHQARALNPQAIKQQVVAFYSGQDDDLSEGARLYLAFLDGLDLLGLAYSQKAVDKAIVDEYLSGILGDPYSISEAFLNEFRRVSRDRTVYQHLELLVINIRRRSG